MPMLRLATESVLPALRAKMARAIPELRTNFLCPEQVKASKVVTGLDAQLVANGCYFLAEVVGALVGFTPIERIEDSTGGTPVPLIRMGKGL